MQDIVLQLFPGNLKNARSLRNPAGQETQAVRWSDMLKTNHNALERENKQ